MNQNGTKLVKPDRGGRLRITKIGEFLTEIGLLVPKMQAFLGEIGEFLTHFGYYKPDFGY